MFVDLANVQLLDVHREHNCARQLILILSAKKQVFDFHVSRTELWSLQMYLELVLFLGSLSDPQHRVTRKPILAVDLTILVLGRLKSWPRLHFLFKRCKFFLMWLC